MPNDKPTIYSIIAAVDERGTLADADGKLPWTGQMPSDIEYLHNKVDGHRVVVGSRTYPETVQHLPTTMVTVLSHQDTSELNLRSHDSSISSPDQLKTIQPEPGQDEVFILGGGQVFSALIDQADRVYLTRIDHDFEMTSGGVVFPEMEDSWRLVSSDKHQADQLNRYDYIFEIYERK